jgi:hypothetical protein
MAIIREGIENGLTPVTAGNEIRPSAATGPASEAATA